MEMRAALRRLGPEPANSVGRGADAGFAGRSAPASCTARQSALPSPRCGVTGSGIRKGAEGSGRGGAMMGWREGSEATRDGNNNRRRPRAMGGPQEPERHLCLEDCFTILIVILLVRGGSHREQISGADSSKKNTAEAGNRLACKRTGATTNTFFGEIRGGGGAPRRRRWHRGYRASTCRQEGWSAC